LWIRVSKAIASVDAGLGEGFHNRVTRNSHIEVAEVKDTPLGDANRDVRFGRRRYVRARYEQWRVTNPIQVIDGMLEELELMNLRCARRVPLSWQPRLALLAASLPASIHVDRAELRAGVSPNRLMEALFCIQDQLFDLKIGPLRMILQEEAS
jgi:hypothetical protein